MYIYGKNACEEAIKNNQKITKVLIWEKFNDRNLISALQNLKIGMKYCSKFELDQVAPFNHQGIILVVPDYKYASLDEITNKENALTVMLDHIEDPHNLGAIIRSCEAAGVDGIIIPKDRCAQVNDTVVKTSAGALSYMKVAQVTNLVQTMQKMKKDGFWFIGTDMKGEDYTKLDYNGKICLVIGNEGKGLSPLVEKECDFLSSIPMKGNINSLNASVATAIIVFEAVKKRGK